jgi:hypothetical protein
MKLNYGQLLIALFALTVLGPLQAQRAKKVSNKPETKIVRNCEYQVLKGLAEIKEVNKITDASESALGYDEYEVKFEFIPMEPGHKLLTTLSDGDFDFKLRSGYDRIPVGPEYVKHYHVRKGLKFAMNFLQTRNNECREKYTYESKGLPNDLFEARDQLKNYKTELAAKKLGEAEEKYSGVEEEPMVDPNNTTRPDDIKDPETPVDPDPKDEDPIEEKVDTPEVDIDTTETVEPKEEENILPDNMTEEELRAEMERKMREEAGLDEDPKDEVDLDSIRAEMERKVREELEAEERRKAEEERKNAIKNERKRKKEEEKRRKEEEKLKAEEEAKRKEALEAKKAEIRAELEAKIQAELEEKQRKEQALKDQIAKEVRRSSCVYKDKMSGTIEIVEVKKGLEKNESLFGYTEYEVKFKFKPDNYKDLSRKDRKVWDEEYTFKLDPKGKSANPSATYVRKYQVFKGNKYKGFAEMLESGICQAIMIYSPDLPIDASKVN